MHTERLTEADSLAVPAGGLQLMRFATPGVDGGTSHILRLIWDGTGVLESATDLQGSWTEVPFATSPYWHEMLPEEHSRFFRVRR